MAKPVLKWAGGKTQILQKIIPGLPMEPNHYHEPFVGGGAVFFQLEPDNGSINDLNAKLINFYKQVKNNHDELLEVLTSLQSEIDSLGDEETEAFYYNRRDEFNELRHGDLNPNPVREAALLLFLNRMCYNGLYRENSSGEFNVPIGSRRNPDVVRKNRVEEANRVLQDTEITNNDFRYVKNVAQEGDAVYFDPPYKPSEESENFEDYLAGGFGPEQQLALRELAIDLHEQGVFVTISNSYAAYELYNADEVPEAFEVREISANRTINSNGSDRTGAKEIVVSNVPIEKRRGTLGPYMTEG